MVLLFGSVPVRRYTTARGQVCLVLGKMSPFSVLGVLMDDLGSEVLLWFFLKEVCLLGLEVACLQLFFSALGRG